MARYMVRLVRFVEGVVEAKNKSEAEFEFLENAVWDDEEIQDEVIVKKVK